MSPVRKFIRVPVSNVAFKASFTVGGHKFNNVPVSDLSLGGLRLNFVEDISGLLVNEPNIEDLKIFMGSEVIIFLEGEAYIKWYLPGTALGGEFHGIPESTLEFMKKHLHRLARKKSTR